MALFTPMSRTRAARLLKLFDSPAGRPNSFTTSAPATLKRSAMVVFIDASSCIASRVMTCNRRPIRLAGMMKAGNTSRVRTVRRHSRPSMTASVTPTVMTLEMTVPRVLVTAFWAPITSLLSRDISAPVWVRVKNDNGIRCTWSNSARRRS
jgi:hypothetical protein